MSSRSVVMANMTRRAARLHPRNTSSMFTATAQTPPAALRRLGRPVVVPRRSPLEVQQPSHGSHETHAALAGLALVTATVCLSPLLRFELMDNNNNNDLLNKSEKVDDRSAHNKSRGIDLTSATGLKEKYQVDWKRELGHGAFGGVYLCHANNKKRESFALKRIDKKGTNAAAFRREVDALQRIQSQGGHPHIVALRDMFEDENYYYLVMDLAKGGEVFEDLVQHGSYSEDQAARMILQLASALQYLHENVGLVHADLKLENLLLLDDNTTNLALADFGCALPASPSGAEKNTAIPPLPNVSSGTLAYWSPERFDLPPQRQQQQVTSAMDMWSVGILLYMLLARAHPFDPFGNATDSEIQRNICSCRTAPTPPVGGPLVQDLLQRLLTKNPKERMTAAELIQHPWIRRHMEAELVKKQLEAELANAAHTTTGVSIDVSFFTDHLFAAYL